MSFRINIAILTAVSGVMFGCSSTEKVSEEGSTDEQEQGWDSQDGNPTHATHSYMTEYALDQLQGTYPELKTYRDTIVYASNREIHDAALSDATLEQLRKNVGGNNWGCDHPEYVWGYAKYFYAKGDKYSAYWYLGWLMHYVEDAGVPAHAFHVYHQSSPSDWDNLEVQATQRWNPAYGLNKSNPAYSDPSSYVAFSATWATGDFTSTYPGVTYYRTFFSTSPLWASSKEKTFISNRQGRTATAVKWAMQTAMTHWQ